MLRCGKVPVTVLFSSYVIDYVLATPTRLYGIAFKYVFLFYAYSDLIDKE